MTPRSARSRAAAVAVLTTLAAAAALVAVRLGAPQAVRAAGLAQGSGLPPSACSAVIGHALAPAAIRSCETSQVTVTIGITCPAARPIHLVIAVDRSQSIEPLLPDVRKSARDVLSQLDWTIPGTMVAVISHGFKIRVESDWTNQASKAQGGVNGVKYDAGDLGENPPLAIDEAVKMFEKVRNDPVTGKPLGAIEIVILYGDGCDPSVPSCPGSAQRASGAASAQGVSVATVCYESGARARCQDYRAMANPQTLSFKAPAGRLPTTVRDMQDAGRGVTVASVNLKDVLPPVLRLVPGSANPPPAVAGQQLAFSWANIAPGAVLTATYRVSSTAVGQTANRTADSSAVLVDSTGREAAPVAVPADSLDVSGPCAPPTATATPVPPTPVPSDTPAISPTPAPSDTPTPTEAPTATATTPSRPGTIYLPVVARGVCLPKGIRSDVALVIDASTSMRELSGGVAKIDAAKAAARAFVGLLKDGDRAAIIAFNTGVVVAADLSADAALLSGAIDGIQTADGTRIDLALDAAAAALPSSADPARQRIIVLLTDGRASTTDDAVLAAAGRAKDGRKIFAIGLGDDIDRVLLRAVATSAALYREAPTGADLEGVYAGIAGTLPCPGGAVWPMGAAGRALARGLGAGR
ncbi:MAG: VWA domain-containing protein [Ardenticatenales bacterium]